MVLSMTIPGCAFRRTGGDSELPAPQYGISSPKTVPSAGRPPCLTTGSFSELLAALLEYLIYSGSVRRPSPSEVEGEAGGETVFGRDYKCSHVGHLFEGPTTFHR